MSEVVVIIWERRSISDRHGYRDFMGELGFEGAVEDMVMFSGVALGISAFFRWAIQVVWDGEE